VAFVVDVRHPSAVSARASTENWYREAPRRGTVTCMSSFFQIYE
jgi:hypothetical protein